MSQNVNKKQQKRKYNLELKPISSAEKRATDSVLDRLLGKDVDNDQVDLQPDLKNDQSDLKVDLDQHDQRSDQTQISENRDDQLITGLLNNPVIKTPGDSNPVIKTPRDVETGSQKNPVIESPRYIVTGLSDTREKGFFIANWIEDDLMPKLEIAEQVILRRIIRLTIGFNRLTSDPVGSLKLAEKCNMSESGVKKSIRSLEQKGMLKVHRDLSGNRYTGGNRYEISFQKEEKTPGYEITPLPNTPITDDDHDDLKRQDHHQRETMMIYQKLTKNIWSKTDQQTYNKIKNIPLEIIEQTIITVLERSTSHPNSLNYFIKEIKNQSNPSSQNKAQRKKAMEKIVTEIRNRNVGGKTSFSDFLEDIKRACIRENVIFDNDVLNEILDKK